MRRQPTGSAFFGSGLLRKFVGGFIIAELAAAGISFYGWREVNQNRETRLYLRDNYPIILEAYYMVGETISKEDQIRKIDAAEWAHRDQWKLRNSE